MANERFVCRMGEDLKNAAIDMLIAKNATPKENRAKMLEQGIQVSSILVPRVEKLCIVFPFK